MCGLGGGGKEKKAMYNIRVQKDWKKRGKKGDCFVMQHVR